MKILFLALVALLASCKPDPGTPGKSRYHDASLDLETQPATTTQSWYEIERRRDEAVRIQEERLVEQIETERSWTETTGEKLARIKARDEAADQQRKKQREIKTP